MEDIRWDELISIKDWSAALKKILDEARTAVEQNDSDKRLALQALLVEYVKKSPAKCEELDTIANQAARDLFLSQIEASLKKLFEKFGFLPQRHENTKFHQIFYDFFVPGWPGLVALILCGNF
jgi:hypothetical protein